MPKLLPLHHILGMLSTVLQLMMSKPFDKHGNVWVRIPDRGDSELNYLISNIDEARKSRSRFTLRSYADVYLDESHVHCEVCWLVISPIKSAHSVACGYYFDDTWVCSQCYALFIAPEDYSMAVNALG